MAPTKSPGRSVRVILDMSSLIAGIAAGAGPEMMLALKNPYPTRKEIEPMNTETAMLM